MTPLASAIESELQLANVAFNQADLIKFVEANRSRIDDEPYPSVWAARFAEMVRVRRKIAETQAI
jgi:hypothetical protein